MAIRHISVDEEMVLWGEDSLGQTLRRHRLLQDDEKEGM